MKFRIVTWNLNGLSLASEAMRLQKAAEAFRVLADDNTTAFALVEVGSVSMLEWLADKLGSAWRHYSGSVGDSEGGIGVLLHTERLSATTLKLRSRLYHQIGRPIQLGRDSAAVFQINCDNKPCFLLAVVHFKAERGGSEYLTRLSQASWLRTELEQFYSETYLPTVIAGDFNGEPWEPMFGREGFRAFRRADVMFRSQDALKLYNPMWKLLSDPLTVATRRQPGDHGGTQVSAPYGTFLGDIWHSQIDGVLASGEWLKAERYILHDDRLEILTNSLWHHISRRGAHYARPKGVTEELAITDHLPVSVYLEVV